MYEIHFDSYIDFDVLDKKHSRLKMVEMLDFAGLQFLPSAVLSNHKQ